MKESPISLPTLEKSFEYRTCGDPVLESMLRAAGSFMAEVRSGGQPRWLSLVGISDTGKTHLAKRIYRKASRSGLFKTSMTDDKEEISYPVEFCYWPGRAEELQKNEDAKFHHMKNVKFLVLDDIGAIVDKSGFVTSKLGILMGQRENMWTVVTANLGPAEIAAKLDTRIASRMIRGRNVLVQCNTTPFALRKK